MELFPHCGERFRRHILSSTLQNLLFLATEHFSTCFRNLSPDYGKQTQLRNIVLFSIVEVLYDVQCKQ